MKIKLPLYLFSLIAMCNTSCTSPNIHSSKNKSYYQKLSYELECSTKSNIGISFIKDTTYLISKTSSFIQTKRNTTSKKIIKNISGDNYKFAENIYAKKEVQPIGNKKTKKKNEFIIDEENIFWKIGMVLGKFGLVLLSVFGGVFISFSGYGSGIFLGGLLITLGVLALSIPFFLLAVITTYMKQKSKTVDDANEI